MLAEKDHGTRCAHLDGDIDKLSGRLAIRSFIPDSIRGVTELFGCTSYLLFCWHRPFNGAFEGGYLSEGSASATANKLFYTHPVADASSGSSPVATSEYARASAQTHGGSWRLASEELRSAHGMSEWGREGAWGCLDGFTVSVA